MNEMTSFAGSLTFSSEKSPLLMVVVPLLVPSTMIVAPGTGSPRLSFTTPLSWFLSAARLFGAALVTEMLLPVIV